jgi:hypothetical protein
MGYRVTLSSVRPNGLLRSMSFRFNMRLMLLLVLPATATSAEWVTVWVAEAKDSKGWYSDWFVDVDSLVGDEQTRRAWVLINMKTDAAVSSGNRGSIRMLWFVDCAAHRFRRLTLSRFRGTMGTGAVITSDHGESTWDYAPPGTAAEAALEFVCSVDTGSRAAGAPQK